jgi:hypothetical protein
MDITKQHSSTFRGLPKLLFLSKTFLLESPVNMFIPLPFIIFCEVCCEIRSPLIISLTHSLKGCPPHEIYFQNNTIKYGEIIKLIKFPVGQDNTKIALT